MNASSIDPRMALIAAVLSLGSEPEGLELCKRFVAEAEAVARPRSPANDRPPQNATLPDGVLRALQGIASGLTIAADHAEYLSEKAARLTSAPPRGPG